MKKHLIGAAVLALMTTAAALAEDARPLPGSGLNAPGSNILGAPPVGAPSSAMWTDKNGDGAVDRDEVAPGSQLEKRFATRDHNKDGKLTPDEYYVPK
jgi:hypothetical protein